MISLSHWEMVGQEVVSPSWEPSGMAKGAILSNGSNCLRGRHAQRKLHPGNGRRSASNELQPEGWKNNDLVEVKFQNHLRN